jgi:multidrug transporter EmrE-like cation transporter
MSLEVLLAVLLGALLHAGWNIMIRGSGLIHVGYFLLVAGAYRHGELSYVYPLMRGTAPALSAIAAALLLAEVPALQGWLGMALICGGVLLLAGDAWRKATPQGNATLFALGTAGIVVIYTLVDGVGVRLSGNAAVYTGWDFPAARPRGNTGLCAAALAARTVRRCLHARLVRAGAVGDDPSAYRPGRGTARDLGGVRHAARGAAAEGARQPDALCRDRRGGGRRGGDQARLNQ